MLFRSFLTRTIILLHIRHAAFEEDLEITTPSDTTTVQPSVSGENETLADGINPISIEILRIILPPGIGNAVKLIWGRKLDDVNLNITYGVHYARDGEDITVPKIFTTNESTVIEDLEFCTKYNFAVTINSNGVRSAEYKINPNDVRTTVTYIDRKAAPKDLKVDFEPREPPCLLLRWSASCPNIGQSIGYVISAFEQSSSHYTIVTLPASKRVDFVYHFKVSYDAKFDIKVSTNSAGSQATETVTYKVPSFLQPYKVRVTSNPDGAFMIYWQEPYVPYYIDRVYYETPLYPIIRPSMMSHERALPKEWCNGFFLSNSVDGLVYFEHTYPGTHIRVYVYQGTNISSNYEKYYVTRPVLVYKGNESRYTFSIGLVSYDGQYRSLLTDPIAADIYGDVREISVS